MKTNLDGSVKPEEYVYIEPGIHSPVPSNEESADRLE